MPVFPASPVSPAEILEDFLPQAFAEVGLPGAAQDLVVSLGIQLEGDEGGEWVLHLERGSVRVAAEPRGETALTYVQTVVDWRGALWEGRGGAMGAQAARLFRPEATPGGRAAGLGPPHPAALEKLRALDGVVRVVVSGGDGGDWQLDLKLGPGALPEAPTTTVTLSAEDAAAMEQGQLDPLQAFMAGRIQVAGDMSLMLQMQAIQMQTGR